jgi:hypothetical protein
MSAELIEGRQRARLQSGAAPPRMDEVYAAQRMNNQTFTHRVFEHCTFANVSFLEATLENCSFLNCAFVGCYFRKVTMRQCDFTGAKFINCTFPEHRLRVESCEFPHAEFRGCYLPFKYGRHNLPRREHNLCEELASALAREADALGDTSDARKYRLIAHRARERNHMAVLLARSAHYRTHRYNATDRIASFAALIRAQLNRRIWGYGESGLILLFNYMLAGLVVFPLLFFVLRDELSNPSGAAINLGDTEFLSIERLLNASTISPVTYSGSWTRILGSVETLTGLLFIGLFIALIIRWTQRR